MTIVTAAIFRSEENFLLFRRAQGEKLAGMWEFPGGKIENGETLEECLKRELQEELNIRAVIGSELGRSIYKYDDGEIVLVAFDVISYSGDINLSVHDQMKWLKISEIKNVDLAPADIGLIDFLGSK